MADVIDTDSIILQAASSRLPPGTVVRVQSWPYLNSVNEEGLDVTLVLADDTPEDLGGVVLEVIVEVNRQLQMAGDDRVPMLRFATEEDLAHRDDPDE